MYIYICIYVYIYIYIYIIMCIYIDMYTGGCTAVVFRKHCIAIPGVWCRDSDFRLGRTSFGLSETSSVFRV